MEWRLELNERLSNFSMPGRGLRHVHDQEGFFAKILDVHAIFADQCVHRTGYEHQFILHDELSVEFLVLWPEGKQSKIELAVFQVRQQTLRPFALHFHTDSWMVGQERLGKLRK